MGKLVKSIAFISILFIGISYTTLAQSWSSDQKEVWAGVEEYWEVSSKGDASAFLSYFDESYIGWSFNSKVPQNKSNTSKWIKNDMANNSTVLYTLTPVSIWVKEDFAFVNYFYGQIEKDKDGKENPISGNWTDILMKKDGKWMIVGDRGGRTSKNQ